MNNSKRLLRFLTTTELRELAYAHKDHVTLRRQGLINYLLEHWQQGPIERRVTQIVRAASEENGG